ncbi:MAG TPA: cyclopropane-fatty-acyl-phospholipid synthase family protein [Candidatus Limnocylindrales bacterium]|nr:cyclopropane-fatty-acyl-phospholipid synthase family protein [Candidatus Limnocylindrales bacterium]
MSERPIVGRLTAGAGSILEQTGERVLLGAAGRISVGRLTVILPDGSRREFVGPEAAEPAAEIHIHDRAAMTRLLVDGETGAGEAYMDGQWSSPDLVALLQLAAINRRALALTEGWWRAPTSAVRTLAHRANRNTVGRARRNIVRHYDLSNEMYRLFLDETMTYSSAVFSSRGQSLADAQRNKYRVMARDAGIRKGAGMRVLEIGSGWGGFALYAAGELGCRVTAITISDAQLQLARERVAEAGLSDRVSVELRDYREVAGEFDAVVSIEMLEAVGAEYFPTYFQAIDRALVPGGRAAVQTISLPDPDYERQRRGSNWIQKYIFPGGLLPSLAAIDRSSERTRLLITEVRDIAPSYARTLREWRTRFLGNAAAVRELGFDDRFIRMWEFYLALSEAGFSTGQFQDLQITLQKRRGTVFA